MRWNDFEGFKLSAEIEDVGKIEFGVLKLLLGTWKAKTSRDCVELQRNFEEN